MNSYLRRGLFVCVNGYSLSSGNLRKSDPACQSLLISMSIGLLPLANQSAKLYLLSVQYESFFSVPSHLYHGMYFICPQFSRKYFSSYRVRTGRSKRVVYTVHLRQNQTFGQYVWSATDELNICRSRVLLSACRFYLWGKT